MPEQIKSESRLNDLKQSKQLAAEYMMKYSQEGWEAKKSGKGKVCWVTAAVPISLLNSFDFHVYLPEIDGINVGVMGEVVKWQLIAENAGYSKELCSYARANMGRVLGGAGEADGAIPPPDFLVTNRMNCHSYIHWWEMLARHYKVPLFVFDGPFWDRPKNEPIPAHYEEYWVQRSYDLVEFLEEHSGERFDNDRYMEAVGYEMEGHKLFKAITESSKRVPTPVNDFDILFCMLPFANLRGKKETVDLYRKIKSEIDERVEKGITALANEKYRIMLMSNPPWFRLDMLPNWLAEADAVIVTSLLNRLLVEYSDVSGANFEEVMRALVKQILNYNISQRVKWGIDLLQKYKCDGMALMDNRGCNVIAFPVPEMMKEIEEKLQIPCFRFEGNMNDPRDFDDNLVRSQFESFIEILGQG